MNLLRNLSIGAKLAVLGGLLNAVALGVGLVGYRGEKHLDASIETLTTVEMPAVRAATLCDMLHDAIHGQGFAAVLHGQAGLEQSRKDASEAGAQMRQHVQELLALKLEPDLHEACTQVAGQLDTYIGALDGVVSAIASGRDGRSELTELDAQFEKLAAAP